MAGAQAVGQGVAGDLKEPGARVVQCTELFALAQCAQENFLQQVVGFRIAMQAMA
jgi:hypothetical protein